MAAWIIQEPLPGSMRDTPQPSLLGCLSVGAHRLLPTSSLDLGPGQLSFKKIRILGRWSVRGAGGRMNMLSRSMSACCKSSGPPATAGCSRCQRSMLQLLSLKFYLSAQFVSLKSVGRTCLCQVRHLNKLKFDKNVQVRFGPKLCSVMISNQPHHIPP